MIQAANVPATPLYRVGRCPDPLAFPPWEMAASGRFDGRFDDRSGEYRVLYAAEDAIACFVETLARFRPSLDAFARLQSIGAADDPTIEPDHPFGVVPVQ